MTDDAQSAPETTPEPKPEPVAENPPDPEAAPATPAAPVSPSPVRWAGGSSPLGGGGLEQGGGQEGGVSNSHKRLASEVLPEGGAPLLTFPLSQPPPSQGGGTNAPAKSALPEPLKPGKRPLVKRHHGIVRITHWLNAILLLGMIGSGLQIYGAFPHFGPRAGPYLPNPWDGKPFPLKVRLGGWLAGGLNWHFALAWPFVVAGLAYLLYMVTSGEWRSLLFRPSDVPKAIRMQLYYLRLRREHPPQGKHNALQKGAYSFILLLGILSVLTGFAIYKPVQLWWLTALFGGYELTRYWHFWAVWIFIAFSIVHVLLVFIVDPASLRSMITGWYRGRFPSHD